MAPSLRQQLRRDEVAQAIADMLTANYKVSSREFALPEKSTIWTGSLEHQELTKKIRKVMDTTYAKT